MLESTRRFSLGLPWLLTLAAAAMLARPGFAQARQKPLQAPKTSSGQTFPTKPIRFIVPFSPGGGTDTLARVVAQKMSENWGQSVVIENRTGAGGAIGTALAAKAAADGYTMLVSSPGFVVSAALHAGKLPYDPIKDFTGVTNIGYSTSALVIAPSYGIKSLKAFIEYGQARPGKSFSVLAARAVRRI